MQTENRACEATLPLADYNDEQLMYALQNCANESLASDLFAELFRRYERRVRAWCLRMTHDRNCATDIMQEVFLKAYRSMHAFRGEARLSTWLYAITRNHCLNVLKKNRTNEPVEITDFIAKRLQDGRALEFRAAVERTQHFGQVWQIVSATLNPVEVRVMALHYGHDVPLAAITKRLALVNPSGAKAYIVNARRKLRGAIGRSEQKLA